MNSLIIILTGVLGATSTFYFSEKLKQGSVRASALLSLVVALFFHFCPDLLNPYLTANIPIVFVGTTYIGMVSAGSKGGYTIFTIAGILFSIIYLNKSQFFNGYGGVLGALAFISLLTTIGIFVLVSRNRKIIKRFIVTKKVQKRRKKS